VTGGPLGHIHDFGIWVVGTNVVVGVCLCGIDVGTSGTVVTGGNTLVGIEGVGGTKLVGTDVGGGIVVIDVWWITGSVVVVVNGVVPGITV